MTTETLEFRAEVRQLLDILANSLYTDKEIFLRELISNASDALNRLQFELLTNRDVLDADVELKITVTGEADGNTLVVSDTGIGMTREELIENLGTIAHSGAKSFIDSVKQGSSVQEIIGRFGVGFYSALMVAEEVQVTSRSYKKDAQAWTWTSRGGDSYTLTEADKAERGTTITLKLKEDNKEFANDWRIKEIIHKHSEFVAFPIYVKDEVVNKQTALWRQNASAVTDEQAAEFYRELTLDFEAPLMRMHLNTDAPVQIYAMLFVPSKSDLGMFSPRREEGLKLYSRKVLIQDYCKDLLPKHFRFIQGVVDSEDLPLNISRETVQSNKVMERIKTAITHKVVDELTKLAKDDKEKYATFWKQFAPFIKEGVSMDYANRQKLYPLLRFTSSASAGEFVSLSEYVARVKPSQKSIYYLLADGEQAASLSPHMDYFRKEGLEVLYLTDPLDHFMISGVPEFEGFKLQSVDDPTLDLPKSETKDETPIAEDDLQSLISKFKTHLGDKVLDVRVTDRLVGSPARLIAQDANAAHDMARVKRLIEKDFQIPKRVLELNKTHALIKRLAELTHANQDEALVLMCMDQILGSALLLEGLHPNPAEMIPVMQRLMEAAVK